MEKNTVVAIVLSTAFLIIWFMLIQPKQTPPVISEEPSQVTQPFTQIKSPMSTHPEQKTSSVPPGAAHAEKEILIETPKSRILFTTRGAAVKKWEINDISGWIDLVFPVNGENLQLATFPENIFTTHAQSKEIHSGDTPYEISFSYVSSDGIVMDKTYRIDPDTYIVDLFITLTNKGKEKVVGKEWSIGWGPGLNTVKRELKENTRQMRAIGFHKEGLVKYRSQIYHEQFNWVAVDNRYFLAALIPQTHEDFAYIYARKEKKQPPLFEWHASVNIKPGEEKTFSSKLYIGPKGYIHLKKLGFKLEEAVNFGFFGFLGKIALRALYFFKKLTGNYGWAIVLLTFCLQFFFIPLTMKSFKATLAMKKLQPQIKSLQTKYKNDSKRLNMEMMNLYKTSGTNPFGGCMPMILQIPVFWALFTTLRNAFELRGAPFIFWIKDLSVYDPFYVLPVLMGIGMLIQQKVMSVSADPTQARMMLFMPIIFTFFFLKFPAGLVLYWLTNSLLTMGVQLIISKRSKK